MVETNHMSVTNIEKFIVGEEARIKWCKPLTEENSIQIDVFNGQCGNTFTKIADIVLDPSPERQSTLGIETCNPAVWNQQMEHIYIIVRNGIIMKIGGTRDGMRGRWSSYNCGYYVPERKKKDGTSYPGKMSVTNAYLYQTIEKDLLETESKWEFWSWPIPELKIKVDIFGEETEIIAQTFHAYESKCIEKFREITGIIPLLCENSDPNYKNKKNEETELEKQARMELKEADRKAKMDLKEADRKAKMDLKEADRKAKMESKEADRKAKLESKEAEKKIKNEIREVLVAMKKTIITNLQTTNESL